MKEARQLLDFACQCYRLQNDSGRLFIHENPTTAQSWKEEGIKSIEALNGVLKVKLDMCQFGLKVKTPSGYQLVRKPTTLLTNNAIMAKTLSKRCDGSHKHCMLKGGNLCSQAAIYSPGFCKAIISGFKRYLHKHGRQKPQIGSLISRDYIDSKENVLQIGEDDPSDVPALDELLEMFAGPNDARFPESRHRLDMVDQSQKSEKRKWRYGMT